MENEKPIFIGGIPERRSGNISEGYLCEEVDHLRQGGYSEDQILAAMFPIISGLAEVGVADSDEYLQERYAAPPMTEENKEKLRGMLLARHMGTLLAKLFTKPETGNRGVN